MKTENLNYNEVIQKILPGYLKDNEINEFNEKIDQQLAEVNTNGAKTEINLNDITLRITIDLLITYSELKLKQDQFLKLLGEIGKLTISSGENELALDIQKKIIKQAGSNNKFAAAYAQALLSMGEILSRQAQWRESFNYLRRANQLFLKKKNHKECARCENLMGTNYGEIGKLKEAKEHFEKSLVYLKKSPDDQLKAGIETNFGIICSMISDYDQALIYYKKSSVYYHKIGDLKRLAEIKQNLGMIQLKRNDLPQAAKEFDQCIDYSIQTGYLQILEIAYVSKAFLFTKLKDYVYAEKFANTALKISCKINDRLSIADIYKVKGIIHRQLANYSLSESYFLTSLRLNKELQNRMNEAETNFELALLYKEIQRNVESKKLLLKSIQFFRKIKATDEVKNIESHLE